MHKGEYTEMELLAKIAELEAITQPETWAACNARIAELEAESEFRRVCLSNAAECIGRRDARITELEAENLAARDLLDNARNETETRQTTQAELRLAKVIELCENPYHICTRTGDELTNYCVDQGCDMSYLSPHEVRAAATGEERPSE